MAYGTKKSTKKNQSLQKSERPEVKRTSNGGQFAQGNKSGGRSKGIGNKLSQEIRAIIDKNKDVFLHRLFRAANLEMDRHIEALEGNS